MKKSEMILQLSQELYEMFDAEYDFGRDYRYNIPGEKINIEEESRVDAELIIEFLEKRGMLPPLKYGYEIKQRGDKMDIVEVSKSEWENET